MTDRIVVTPQMFKEVFEDDRRGALLLQFLIDKFVRPPVTEGGIDAVLKTYQRAGQRAPLDYISAMIDRANGVDPNEDQGE